MNIYNYIDYRAYLRSYIASRPKRGRGEINRLARFAGVHPSLMSQILAGDKNLSLEQAQAVAELIGLTSAETESFLAMVQYQRAGTVKLRDYFHGKLRQLQAESVELSQRVRQDRELTSEEKSIFYSHWLYAAAWLLTSVGTGATTEEVAQHFEITPARAAEILEFLRETNLCVAEGRRFRMGPQSVHLERTSPHLPRHHANWRLRAIESSDAIDPDEMMYTAPLSLSEADLKLIRSRLADVVKEVTDVAIKSPAETLVCFNLDLFRIRR